MSYRFHEHESVREAFARCAAEQLDRAADELSQRIDSHPVDAVHTARKAVKKERSLLRLTRGALPRQQRRRENQALREAAGDLSRARDAEAMLQTMDALAGRYVGQLPARTFEEIRTELEGERDRARRELEGSAQAQQAVGKLAAIAARAGDWELKHDDWSAIEPGLRRTYRDGRRAMHAARRQHSDGRWHGWRKRVKDLWYAQRLLAEIGGPALAGQAKDAHRLADLLGDDHDLAVLRDALTHGHVDAPVDTGGVVALIDHRREELREEALALGDRVYAEKPQAYVARTHRMWRAGRKAATVSEGERPAALVDATRTPVSA